jgi:hypothetical protein
MTPATNPFAIAVEALREREESLTDNYRDALHVAEIYSENKAVVESQTEIAAWFLERLADTRAALAVFERLAAIEVKFLEFPAMSEAFATAESPPVSVSGSIPGMPEAHEAKAACHLRLALECRRRNEAQP